ncbi:MAG: O-antigen ligase family protein [Candidatus Omnitrophica bacterium]|nr:O-antigen ligase family protein [Candidatus Omnitrophota bacterium]
MPINILNYITEFTLWVFLFGSTFSNSLSEITIGIIIGVFILKKILCKKYFPLSSPINLMLYILCGIVFITFLRSAYFSESVRGFVRIVKFTFLYFALIDFFQSDAKRLKRTFWVLMIVACVTFLNGIFQSIYGFDLLRHKEFIKDDCLRRIQASFVHPNDFGAYIILILPLTLCFFSSSIKRGQRAFLIMNCILGAYCLFKTSSRGAWLGFIVGIVIYFFFYKRKVTIAVPLAMILLVMLLPHGFDRLKSLFALEQNTVWERTQLWKGTWNMVKAHPFFGFGINTFSRYFPQYKPSVYWGIMYSHNSYLQMWSEIGIFGLLAFLSIIFAVLRITLRDMRKKMQKGLEGLILLGLTAGYIAFLIQSGLDTNLFSLKLITLFWVMTAYLVSLNKYLEEEKVEECHARETCPRENGERASINNIPLDSRFRGNDNDQNRTEIQLHDKELFDLRSHIIKKL